MIEVYGGAGFIGSQFCKSRDDVIIKKRDDYISNGAEEIIYFISTVDNYNVLENPFIDIDTNLTTLMKVLKTVKPGATFNFISSWFVYGDTELPAKETSFCNPKGFYSITKRAAEQLLISYCETFNINYRILRLANVVGAQDNKVSKKKNALQYLINRIKCNEPVSLYNGGLFVRDYIDIEDCVYAINLVLEKGEKNNVYNIGNGVPIVFKDLITYAAEKTNSTSKIDTMEPTDFHKTIQVTSMYMDNTKLQKLGYVNFYNQYNMIDKLL